MLAVGRSERLGIVAQNTVMTTHYRETVKRPGVERKIIVSSQMCLHTFRGADKSLAVSHFCRGDLVGRTNFGMIFEWLSKVRATG